MHDYCAILNTAVFKKSDFTNFKAITVNGKPAVKQNGYETCRKSLDGQLLFITGYGPVPNFGAALVWSGTMAQARERLKNPDFAVPAKQPIEIPRVAWQSRIAQTEVSWWVVLAALIALCGALYLFSVFG
jgi:hypothetical protein